MSDTLDLMMRLDSEFQDKGFKSAEASAKILQRELDRMEKAERELANMQIAAAREEEARRAAQVKNLQKVERAERDLANLQIAAQREAEQRRAAQLMGMDQLGQAYAKIGLAAAIGVGLASKAASDWESAWAGVTKTVDGTPEQMAELEKELRELATTLPATHEEIAAVAEAAGQLGVKRQDVASFTKTMIDLGVSTNLSAQDAATGLAQLGNIMGVLPSEAGRAGAALVALGNDGASTEADILAMSLRIAGAGKTIGLSEADVLSYANALASMGIEAEAGGSSISRVMVDIAQAVRNGGDSLTIFAGVAGQSTAQFQKSFQTDAAGAVAAFINGLGRMQASGQDTFGVLDELGLSEIRVRDTLLRTANAGDLLTDSLVLGNKSWEENLALVEEANKRYETNESKIARSRNELNDMAIDIGAKVLPAIAGAGERVGFLAQTFTALPDEVQESVVVLGTAVTVITLVGGAALMAIPKLAAMNATLAATGPRGTAAAAGLSRVGGALMGPWGIALAAGSLALGVFAEKQFKAKERSDEFKQSLDAQTGALTDASLAAVANRLQEDGTADRYKVLTGGLKTLTEAAVGNVDALRTLRQAQADNAAIMDRLMAKGSALTAAEYSQLEAVAGRDEAYKNLFNTLGPLNDQYATDIRQQREVASVTTSATDAAAGFNAEMGVTEKAAKEARDEIDQLIKSIEDYGDTTIDARKANRDYQETIDEIANREKKRIELQAQLRETQNRDLSPIEKNKDGSIDKDSAKRRASEEKQRADDIARLKAELEGYNKTLDANTEAGRKNQEIQDQLKQDTLLRATAAFEDGASVEMVTKLVLEGREAFIDFSVAMGSSREEAEKLADTYGLTRSNIDQLRQSAELVPKDVTTEVNAKTEAALTQLAKFQKAIDSLHGKNIGVGVRYAYTGTLPNGGKSKAGGITFDDNARGGIYEFAAGGFLPQIGDQRPTIKPNQGGEGIRWAETGAGPWEAFISGNPAYHNESVANWVDVGRRLGTFDSSRGTALAGAGGRAESHSETFHQPVHIARLYASDTADIQRQAHESRVAALRGQDQ